MIQDVIVKPLERISDERGTLMKMIQCTDSEYKGFGEIYFSTVYYGSVKGWHMHRKKTRNYAVLKGMIKLVLFDAREDSATKGQIDELFIGIEHYCLVQIPPGVWSAFQGLSKDAAIVADLTDLPYDKDDSFRIDINQNDLFTYRW